MLSRVCVCFMWRSSNLTVAGFRQLFINSSLIQRSIYIGFECNIEFDPIQWLVYSVSQKNPRGFLAFFPKWLGIFQPNFTHLLCIPIYARLQIFVQLVATLTKLCHIKRDHPDHIMCAKCPPSAETHADIFPKQLGIFSPNFTRLLYVYFYARIQIFV